MTTRSEAVARPWLVGAFARHETFHPRYGWLRKGYLAAEDPKVFLHAEATTILGVGKNMVRAIRHWGLAFKVIEEVRNDEDPRLNGVRRSAFGDALLGEGGWDPYCENPGTLWLLHWYLFRPVPECRAPAWWAVFNSPPSMDFSDSGLLAELRRFCDERESEFGEVAESSLEKDVRCILRMYGSVTQGRDLPEDSIDSPFSELGLIRSIPGSPRLFAINRARKRTLPDAIVAFACLDHLAIRGDESRIVSLSGLTRSPGSPGRIFALSETELGSALTRYAAAHPGSLGLTDAAGLAQLIAPDDPAIAAQEILEAFYDQQV